MAQAMQRSGS